MDCGISHSGDCRLDEAASFLHDRLVRIGPRGISVRGVAGNRAGEVRIGRFLRNRKVTVDRIVEKAARGTAARVDKMHILAIQDTTGFRDDGSGNSLVAMRRLQLRPNRARCMGWSMRNSLSAPAVSGSPRKTGLFATSRASRWIDSMQASAECLKSAALVTVVADR